VFGAIRVVVQFNEGMGRWGKVRDETGRNKEGLLAPCLASLDEKSLLFQD
jgi:hypothetical protein